MENEYELVHSPLSGKISGDSLTVEVFIYRGKDAEDDRRGGLWKCRGSGKVCSNGYLN
jgi:hypothetical protein